MKSAPPPRTHVRPLLLAVGLVSVLVVVAAVLASPEERSLAPSDESRCSLFQVQDTEAGRDIVLLKPSDAPRRITASGDVVKVMDALPQPDGTARVLYGRGSGAIAGSEAPVMTTLWLLDEATGRHTQVTATGDVEAARFSPDGAEVAYVTTAEVLMVRNIGTGAERRLLSRVSASSIAWSPDGQKLVTNYYETPGTSGTSYGSSGGGIAVVDAKTGVMAATAIGGTPLWLPSGRGVLFSQDGNLMVLDLVSGQGRLLARRGRDGPSSPILWVSGGAPALVYQRGSPETAVWRLEFDQAFTTVIKDERISAGLLGAASICAGNTVPILNPRGQLEVRNAAGDAK